MNNRNDLDKEWYFITFIKSIQFFLVLVMIGMITLPFYYKCEQPKKQVPKVVEYECPIVADTVKNDWAKDENICIEKRLVYDQMLEDGWR
jgi:hypothetical protein